jgi:hypothetical protein
MPNLALAGRRGCPLNSKTCPTSSQTHIVFSILPCLTPSRGEVQISVGWVTDLEGYNHKYLFWSGKIEPKPGLSFEIRLELELGLWFFQQDVTKLPLIMIHT